MRRAVLTLAAHMSDVQARVLRHALEVVGSEEKLAIAINAAHSDLEAWLLGSSPVPLQVFLDALDIVAAGKKR